MKLLVGTRSPGKTREIRELFAGLPFEVSFPADRLLQPLPEEADLERSMSYVENAVAKARYYAMRGGLPAVSDDSGIEVDALGGGPGVRSARFAAEGATDEENLSLLLGAVADVDEAARTARYRCLAACAWPDGRELVAEATCEGRLTLEPRGNAGFGYDPAFVPEGYGETMAELPPEEKNRISHRGKALRALGALLRAD